MSSVDTGSFDFSLKLDKLLSSDSQNMVFSPFSLSTALAMILLGAHNKSGEELSKVLFGIIIKPNKYQSLAKEYQILVKSCLKTNEEVLSSANFLYSHINYPILQNYKQMIELSFGSKTKELDFDSKIEEAIDTINSDISGATNGKIPKLLDKIGVNTKMVLANALYFKGLWESMFKKEETKSQKFTTNDKTEIDVQMMYQNSKLPFVYSKQLECRAIQMGYKNSNIVMIVILPEENSSVKKLKSKLNAKTLNKLLESLKNPQKTDIYLPKFKIESTLELIPVLSEIGIKQIFDQRLANLSGITTNSSGLYVGNVIQKVVIEVNEEGTEAAAATAMRIQFRCREVIQRFEANRPFMFLLISKYDSDKNIILFTGTVNNPNF